MRPAPITDPGPHLEGVWPNEEENDLEGLHECHHNLVAIHLAKLAPLLLDQAAVKVDGHATEEERVEHHKDDDDHEERDGEREGKPAHKGSASPRVWPR